MSEATEPKTTPTWQRQVLIHGAIILAFLALLMIYFNPVLSGRVIEQEDIVQFQGMAKETRDYRAETGKEALWVGTLFSGMPAYLTSTKYTGDLFYHVNRYLQFGLPQPISFIFMIFLGFFFLLRTLNVNVYLSGVGAAAYALSSYFFIILDAGHTSKAQAISMMAPILAGIFMAYRGKVLLGSAITAFFLATMISANHLQMTYYLALMILALGIFLLVDAIRNKTFPQFAKASAGLIIAALLAVGPNVARLWTTNAYAQESNRGPAVLTTNDPKKDDGMDIDYALQWSYGIGETFTLLIPNYHGGASQTALERDSDTFKELRKIAGQQAGPLGETFPTYWGDQPSTSGPVYVGAIVCFLFVLGLLLVPGPMKWWLLTITVITVMLSWGRNLQGFTELFYYNFPMYNKFRAVSMMLVVAEITFPLLGFLALNRIMEAKEKNIPELSRKIAIAAGITGGLSLLMAVLGSSFLDFQGLVDTQLAQWPDQLKDLLISHRKSMFQQDAFRSAILIAIGAGLIWLYVQGRVKNTVVYLGLGALVVIDLLSVDNRYLNDEDFVRPRRYQQTFNTTVADQEILKDTDPDYRVLNLTRNIAYDALTPYHHRSVGGYHAAKLRRYADLLERQLQPELQELSIGLQALQAAPSDSILQAIFGNLDVLNMLNTRYIIYNPQAPPLRNTQPLGAAWFVQNIQEVPNPDAEMKAMDDFDPARTAIVDTRFADQVAGFSAGSDATASIQMDSYLPNHLVYSSQSQVEQVAIFSEIYYDGGNGWNAYLDGELVPHFRANYVLRGMRIPAGSHKIEFKFEPRSYLVGNQISLVMSILLILLLLGAGFWEWRSQQKKEAIEKA